MVNPVSPSAEAVAPFVPSQAAVELAADMNDIPNYSDFDKDPVLNSLSPTTGLYGGQMPTSLDKAARLRHRQPVKGIVSARRSLQLKLLTLAA